MKLLLEVMLWIIGIPTAVVFSIGLAGVAMYMVYSALRWLKGGDDNG